MPAKRKSCDAVLHRCRAVDRENPVLDRPRAEAALGRHLAAAGHPGFPVRWVTDLEEGRLLAKRAHPETLLAALRVPRRPGDPLRHPPLKTLAVDYRWTHISMYPLSEEQFRTAWTELESSLMGRAFRSPAYQELDLGELHLPRSAALGGLWSLACSLERRAVFEPLLDAFEAGVWIYWVLPGELIALPLPEIHTQNGLLHNETGPAVSWTGGEKHWICEGVHLNEDLVMGFHRLTPERIRWIANLEIRRVLIRRYGEARFLQDAGARVIEEDSVGALYHLDLPGDEPLAMVRVENSTLEADGTRKSYFLRVPPEMGTAREAIAWTFLLDAKAYAPAIET